MRQRRRGQAMLEFAMVFAMLIVGLTACLCAAVWGVDGMAVDDAAEKGVRLALSAAGTGGSSAVADIDAVTAASTPSNPNPIVDELQAAMVGTQVRTYAPNGPNPRCHTPNEVASRYQRPTVELCAFATSPGNPPSPHNLRVEVHITGCASLLIPVPFTSHICSNGVAVDTLAVMHPETFQE